jgi:bifunctional non-homologous end joining protein LigD
MPGFISPQLATLKMKAPSGLLWIHEIKYDGYRIQLHIDGDDRRAYTRNGYNWVSRFSRIAGAFDIEGQAIVDGEVVVIHEGRTNFSELQADLGRGDQDRLIYFAFDLLWLDGRDLRKEPQIERKRLLKELIEEHDLKEPVFYSEHHEGDGQALFAAASKLNYEGIVSKRVDAPYRSERVEAWQKIKLVQKGKFPVVGFIKDPSGVAALYLGKKEGKDLVYMGKVGTGWSRTTSAQIRKALDTVSEPEAEADEDHQEAEGHLGRAQVLRRHRVPRHHLRRPSAGKLVQGPEQRNAPSIGAFASEHLKYRPWIQTSEC